MRSGNSFGLGVGKIAASLVFGLCLLAVQAKAELPADSQALLDLYTQASARTFRLAAVLNGNLAIEGAGVRLGTGDLILTRLSAVSRDGGKSRATRILLYARPELGAGSPNRPQEPLCAAALVAFDAKSDLALLKAAKPLGEKDRTPFAFAQTEGFVIAFPQGQPWTMSLGRIETENGELVFSEAQGKALVGSPLFDGKGALLGLLKPAAPETKNARFGAPGELEAWLKRQKRLPTAAPGKAVSAKPLVLRPGLVYSPQSFEALHTLSQPPKTPRPKNASEPKETFQ